MPNHSFAQEIDVLTEDLETAVIPRVAGQPSHIVVSSMLNVVLRLVMHASGCSSSQAIAMVIGNLQIAQRYNAH